MRISNIDSNNNQSFGTTGKLVNNLGSNVTRNKLVSKVVKGLNEGMLKLERNGQFDSIESKLVLRETDSGKIVMLITKLFKPSDKGFTKRKVVVKDVMELFKFHPRNKRVDLQKDLVKCARAAERNKGGHIPIEVSNEQDVKYLKENIDNLIPTYYNKILSKNPKVSKNQVIIKGAENYYKLRKNHGFSFSQLDQAMQNMANKNDSALVKFKFIEDLHPGDYSLSDLKLKMSVYSSTLKNGVKPIKKSVKLPLMVIDNDKNLVINKENKDHLFLKSQQKNGIQDWIEENYNLLIQRLKEKIVSRNN